jgi:hypothetical protein
MSADHKWGKKEVDQILQELQSKKEFETKREIKKSIEE